MKWKLETGGNAHNYELDSRNLYALMVIIIWPLFLDFANCRSKNFEFNMIYSSIPFSWSSAGFPSLPITL